MSTFINPNAFRTHEIKCINYYRLHLGVTTLSDITLAHVETLDPNMRSVIIPVKELSKTTIMKTKLSKLEELEYME
eukprot:7874350-Ditylum_brightwellii.AAC.1